MTQTKFNLSVSDVRGRKTNTSYPYRVEIGGVDDLKKAAAYDHAGGAFRNHRKKNGEVIKGHRSVKTFVECNCDIYDCDNDPENRFLPDIPPEQWKTPADIDALFPNVESYTVYSRHHMIEKDGRPARPKFHKYYPRRKPLTDEKKASDYNKAVQAYCPAFDEKALDAARFIFSVENPVVEYVPGELTLDEFMAQKAQEQPQKAQPAKKPKIGGVIHAGHRNSTLSSAAFTFLIQYGADDGKALEAFLQTAAKCEPPLDDSELKTIWNSALKGYAEKKLTDPDYMPAAEYMAQEFAGDIEPGDYTDVGQAQLFFEQYSDRVRYSAGTKWLVYNGRKWDESELKAHGLAQELTDRQLAEARKRLKKARAAMDKAIETGDEDAQKEAKAEENAAKGFRAFVLGRRKTSRIAATLTEAEPAAEISTLDLDADGFLLNTPAGTVDLRTGEMRAHDPNDYITKMTAVSPSPDGMELWLAFLERMTCGDKSLQEYHQIVAGMQAVGKVYVENLIIATGSGGNGKSTFYNSQARVMGDYASSLSSDVLITNSRKNKSPEYAELRGKRLVIAAELEEGMRLDTGVVKRLCSVDPIRAEKKFKAPFDFIPSHTTVLYTNHLPKVGTNDKGTWDRLVVVPFGASFRGEKGEIFNYGDYLVEHAGGAILTWIIEGAKKFIAAKFHIEKPECVARAIREYRQQNDWFHNFIDDRCEIGGSFSEGSQAMYLNYRSYCDDVGDYKRSAAEFKNEMMKAGYKWHKSKTGAAYYGIRLASEFLDIPLLSGTG